MKGGKEKFSHGWASVPGSLDRRASVSFLISSFLLIPIQGWDCGMDAIYLFFSLHYTMFEHLGGGVAVGEDWARMLEGQLIEA